MNKANNTGSITGGVAFSSCSGFDIVGRATFAANFIGFSNRYSEACAKFNTTIVTCRGWDGDINLWFSYLALRTFRGHMLSSGNLLCYGDLDSRKNLGNGHLSQRNWRREVLHRSFRSLEGPHTFSLISLNSYLNLGGWPNFWQVFIGAKELRWSSTLSIRCGKRASHASDCQKEYREYEKYLFD